MMAWGFDRSSADKNKYKSLKAVVDTVAQSEMYGESINLEEYELQFEQGK
ncbi:unnamed protein product [Nippostrongylus brasiliensis]|uniref:Yippee domain-containing protein n=1 Tax=Nippostrongylus brasiliensis TaxID=27835 RepID=A0A0N4XPL8_NIPBR|nr:unnamed protein product [Nippostrongylus brasiliensis]